MGESRYGSSASAKKGLDFVAKVMAGDHFDIFGKSYHNSTGNSAVPLSSTWVTTLLSGLLGASGGVAAAGSHGATATALQGVSGVSSAMGALHTSMENFTNGPGGLPQAGICWILFDEQFHIKAKHFSPVNDPGSVYDHYNDPDLQNILVAQNGYLYVYCTNESGVDVFFDNLQVVHTRGPLLEETHYYPFGLTMQGISSKAAGKAESNKKFQGQEFAHGEFSDGSGLEMYEFKYRMDDPQTGRFWQIDPLADKYVYNSTYAFSENKVTSHVELEGLESYPMNLLWGAVKSEFRGTARSIDNTVSLVTTGSSSVETGSKTIGGVTISNSVTTSTTSESSFNFLGIVNYLMNNNTLTGNTEPLTKTTTTTSVTADQKVEFKKGKLTVTNKTSTDLSSGVVSNESSVEVAKKNGTAITVLTNASSDGSTGAGVEVSTGKNTKVKAIANGTTNGTNSSFQIGFGWENIKSKVTTTVSSFLKFSF